MVTGETYYVDHVGQTTHWSVPAMPVPQRGALLPLPVGWEFRPEPQPHFVDTITGPGRSGGAASSRRPGC
jgi:hypothetical protein